MNTLLTGHQTKTIKPKKFAAEKIDLNSSYYVTNKIFKLTLYLLYIERMIGKQPKNNFFIYEMLGSTLSANYLKTDFGTLESKDFINESDDALKQY